MKHLIYIFVGIFTGLVALVHSPNLNNGITNAAITFVSVMAVYLAVFFLSEKGDPERIRIYSWGLIIGFAAFGLSWPFIDKLTVVLKMNWVAYIFLGGLIVLAINAVRMFHFHSEFSAPLAPITDAEAAEGRSGQAKILDTSIIIDGRIIDIASAGFVENPLVVPNFVLREIQLISDSPDPIKRNRGRRGLDMLNQLQKRKELNVQISYKDYTETREVDAKLVKLAKEIDGKLITNDFNLNKVAELQGVEVLNINNLANALKPVVLPGEEMEISVVKEGKDADQGIGYLDDGTMVVIENGGKLLNKRVKVSVTSVIQTSAGKMIFTKIVS